VRFASHQSCARTSILGLRRLREVSVQRRHASVGRVPLRSVPTNDCSRQTLLETALLPIPDSLFRALKGKNAA